MGPIGIDRAGKAFDGASWSVLATLKVRNFLYLPNRSTLWRLNSRLSLA
tara:strand:+ start:170 stop:316 length:147 start_codon:yes stop_codon:yes gene_type:complete